MRNYAKVGPGFWTGEFAEKIHGDTAAISVAAYLMFSPHSTMTGLYRLPIGYIAADLGISVRKTSGAMRKLEDAGFIEYDAEAHRVWVVEAARHEFGTALSSGDKRSIGILDALQEHRKSRLYDRFMERYGEAFGLNNLGWAGESTDAATGQDAESSDDSTQAPSGPSGYSTDYPTMPHAEVGEAPSIESGSPFEAEGKGLDKGLGKGHVEGLGMPENREQRTEIRDQEGDPPQSPPRGAVPVRDPSELWFPVRAKPGEEGLDDRMVGGRRISGRLLADEEVVALADGLPDGFDARAKLLEIAEELLESAKGRPRSRGLKQVLRSRLGNSPDLPVEIPAELVELIPDIAERWSRRMAAAREKHGTKSARRTAQLEQLDHLLDVAKTRGVEQARRLLSVAIRSSWLGLDIKWLDGHETGGGGGSRPAPGGGGRFGREDDEEGWL